MNESLSIGIIIFVYLVLIYLLKKYYWDKTTTRLVDYKIDNILVEKERKSANPYQYYCHRCDKYHYFKSIRGHRHLKYNKIIMGSEKRIN